MDSTNLGPAPRRATIPTNIPNYTWLVFHPFWKKWKSIGIMIANERKDNIHAPNHQPVTKYTHAKTCQNDPQCDHIKTLNVDIYASDYLADTELLRHGSMLDAHTTKFLNAHPNVQRSSTSEPLKACSKSMQKSS